MFEDSSARKSPAYRSAITQRPSTDEGQQ